MSDAADHSKATVGRINFGRGVSKTEEHRVYQDAADLLRRLRQENEELKRKNRALIEHCRRQHGCDALREIE